MMGEKTPLTISSLKDPGERYTLLEILGSGVCGTVHLAIDSQASGKKVAIKIQKLTADNAIFIQEEFRVLRDYSDHPNLPDFYGVYKKSGTPDEVWFVMEYCEGGPITDLVVGLQACNRRMSEDHIAYILREVIKALVHLHERNVMHRDVCGSNVLLTRDGEVKLIDFGLSRELEGSLGKRTACLGSPCWMAPEMVTSEHSQTDGSGYGTRADVWAVGITAIEIGDGKPPFQDAHPTRTMFQIVRNPPPGLNRPANWSQNYNDFICECLEKNQEHRPFMVELLEHPFFENIPENDYYLTQELRQLGIDFAEKGRKKRHTECIVQKNLLRVGQSEELEIMHSEDLAALEEITEDAILTELYERMQKGHFQTFVGDILLVLNPNERQDIYGPDVHAKYKFKSRSDNAPHIYAVADSAYQDVLHHEEPQNVLLAGESLSGKTTCLIHLIEHFSYLGQSPNNNSGQQVLRALSILHALGNASTPVNPNSTRCILQTQMTFGSAGKISGAIFFLYQLEKWRVSSTDMSQANFNIFYYFYDAMNIEKKLETYELASERKYRYLRVSEAKSSSRPRDNPKQNLTHFLTVQQNLLDLGFEDSQIETIWTVLAAILHLGDIQFKDTESEIAEIDNPAVAITVAHLLHVDERKFMWALTNYCSIKEGTATRKKHTSEQARDVRDILANNMYSRLVDWTVNTINQKLSFGRAVFGDKYTINILDLFGFECFQRNKMEQLFVNCMNEQMQYHFTQRVFAWEMLEQQEEHVPAAPLTYFDNHPIVEELMGKTISVLAHIDDASKNFFSSQHIIDGLRKSTKTPHVKVPSGQEFVVAHYTGAVVYDVREMPDRNRDFLPPEMIESLRLSSDAAIRQFFSTVLTKTGNLALHDEQSVMATTTRKVRWGTMAQPSPASNFGLGGSNFSQTRQMRTAANIFRATSLQVLRALAVSPGSGGTQFVRCIRADLTNTTRGFQLEIVRQQLRALAILDTAKARQKGYPHRVPFNEFLRRYKFLAFDFDENVEITKDNCRLLLVRLKMEGWVIGRSKVFLQYYNEEYLSRLYETQVKKIIKVQCMMRAFLARRNVALKLKKSRNDARVKAQASIELTQDSAATVIQKAFRGYAVRKEYGPLINKNSGTLDDDTAEFIRPYALRWRNKTMFQVILQYRAARFQDTVYFSQQVHIYNQSAMTGIQVINTPIAAEKVNVKAILKEFLGDKKPTVWKLPFRFDKLPYFDTTYMCDPYSTGGPITAEDDQEAWDTPLRWRQTIASQVAQSLNIQDPTNQDMPGYSRVQTMVNIPFCRDPTAPVNHIPSLNHTNQRHPSPCKRTVFSAGPTKVLRSKSPPKADHDFNFSRSPHSTPAKYVLPTPKTTVNPIRELELIGRKNSQNSAADEPPFNFQSMLRKTNYNRESMKRSKHEVIVPITEYRTQSPPKMIDTTYDEEIYVEHDKNMMNHVVYRKDNNANAFVSSDEEISNGNDSPEIITATELAPGIIIEGLVTNL